MKYGVRHQESYSRGELLLRTLFGVFYIALPHVLVLIFLMLASAILNFITFWAILITGKFPQGIFDYQLKLHRWQLRLASRLQNLSDGYPSFGLNVNDDNITIEMERPAKSNRLTVLLRLMFGVFYVYIPHMICLLFLGIGASFVRLIAFWVVLITGKYPVGMHNYMVGVMRWQFRVNAYMTNMTDTYPPFSMSGNEAKFEGDTTSSNDLLDN